MLREPRAAHTGPANWTEQLLVGGIVTACFFGFLFLDFLRKVFARLHFIAVLVRSLNGLVQVDQTLLELTKRALQVALFLVDGE